MIDPSVFATFPFAALTVLPIEIATGLVANFIMKKKLNLEQARQVTREFSEFQKEYREALRNKDQAKLDKLKKRQRAVQEAYMKVNSERMKVTFIYLFPLVAIYYLVGYIIGFRTVVAASPYQFNLILISATNSPIVPAGLFGMSLFTWYFISYFAVNLLLGRLMGTTPT
ncbi:MAG: EMC3/TMCO1 family protein [Nitrososphaerota archaeon]